MRFSRKEYLEWVNISSSRGSSQPKGWTCVSCIGRQMLNHWATWEAHRKRWWWCFVYKSFPTLVTPWTVVHQAPLSMGFSRQEHWSRLSFPSPDLPDPGIKPGSPALQADSLSTELQGKPKGKIKENKHNIYLVHCIWNIRTVEDLKLFLWAFIKSSLNSVCFSLSWNNFRGRKSIFLLWGIVLALSFDQLQIFETLCFQYCEISLRVLFTWGGHFL